MPSQFDRTLAPASVQLGAATRARRVAGQMRASIDILAVACGENTGGRMPFENQPYPWSPDSIIENAPRHSAIYGLYSALWIYIGEADDLRECLMEHFKGDSPCIARYVPSHFVFELIDDRTVRESRCRELVRQHGPVCNAKQASQE